MSQENEELHEDSERENLKANENMSQTIIPYN
jgi:hypothetical protein